MSRNTMILPIPMGSGGGDMSNYYTKDEVNALIADFITITVDDLTNYYLKSETYTKAEIENLVGQITSFEVVTELPSSDIKTNVIYLLGPIGTGADRYEEYIYSNNAWKKIGETSIDLSNYVTVTQLNSALGFYTTTFDLNLLLQGKQDVLTAGTGITISSNVISADIPAVGTGVVTLTQNGATIGTFGLNDSDNKTIDIQQDGAWYGTQAEFDALGTNIDTDTTYYISDQLDWSEIANRPNVPTKVSELTNDLNYTSRAYVDYTQKHPNEKAIMQIVNSHNVYLTQAEYDALGTNVDPDTNYHIEGDEQTLSLTFTLADQSTVAYDILVSPAQ